MVLPPEPPEKQRPAEEGARHPEQPGGDAEHDSRQGPPPRAEPVEEAPHGEGDRGLDGFK
jgi:hypothetical protein